MQEIIISGDLANMAFCLYQQRSKVAVHFKFVIYTQKSVFKGQHSFHIYKTLTAGFFWDKIRGGKMAGTDRLGKDQWCFSLT